MREPQPLFGRVLLAAAVAALGQQPAPASAQPAGGAGAAARYECGLACGGTEPSPYCMVAPRDAKLAAALGEVRQRLNSAGASRIAKADLLRFFEQTQDPCTRSDTVRENGVWSNKGAACLLSVNVDVFPGAAKVPIRVHLPSELYFSVSQQAGWLKLTSRTTASILEIGEPNLHNDWGGAIQAVYADASSAFFQLPRGCIKIPL